MCLCEALLNPNSCMGNFVQSILLTKLDKNPFILKKKDYQSAESSLHHELLSFVESHTKK